MGMYGICLFLLCYLSNYFIVVMMFPDEWQPNYQSTYDDAQLQKFVSYANESDTLKLLLIEDDKVFIGGRNHLYYISLLKLQIISSLEWRPRAEEVDECLLKEMLHCDNYIRVALRQTDNTILVCGTNAHNAQCRHYEISESGSFKLVRGEEDGKYRCPNGATDNYTILIADDVIFSTLYIDKGYLDPAISKWFNINNCVTTRLNDRLVLNDPQFVSSLLLGEYVYFFFRETAIEDMNGESVKYSRVSRICKGDGGDPYGSQSFTTYFKAKISCTLQGNPKFHFNEMQFISDLGKVNFKGKEDQDTANNMFYGVFNTPANSIWGSAVCTYNFQDIQDVFEGDFKTRSSKDHVWQTVGLDKLPMQNLTKCNDNRSNIDVNTLYFIYEHPLMDKPVEPMTNSPILVYSNLRSRLTSIAVDWRVLSLDDHYYNVIFVGTTDGRVIKFINVDQTTKVETVVIEDIRVFSRYDAVVNLQIVRKPEIKLLVSASYKVVSIPLHRCGVASDCSACVGLRDPYCSFDLMTYTCSPRGNGLQDIHVGYHPLCTANESFHNVIQSPSRAADEKLIYTDVLSAIMTGTGIVIAVGVIIIIVLQWNLQSDDDSLTDDSVTPKSERKSISRNSEPETMRTVFEVITPGNTWV